MVLVVTCQAVVVDGWIMAVSSAGASGVSSSVSSGCAIVIAPCSAAGVSQCAHVMDRASAHCCEFGGALPGGDCCGSGGMGRVCMCGASLLNCEIVEDCCTSWWGPMGIVVHWPCGNSSGAAAAVTCTLSVLE